MLPSTSLTLFTSSPPPLPVGVVSVLEDSEQPEGHSVFLLVSWRVFQVTVPEKQGSLPSWFTNRRCLNWKLVPEPSLRTTRVIFAVPQPLEVVIPAHSVMVPRNTSSSCFCLICEIVQPVGG